MVKIIRNNVIGLLQAADELELTVLLDCIQDELIEKHVDWVNNHLVELLRTCALLQSCKRLFEHCQNKVSSSPSLIFESADFESVEHDVLKSLLENEKLNVDEIKVWEKMISWGKAQLPDLISSDSTSWTKEDFVKLKDVVKELVPLIRFVSISSADFCYKVMPYKRIIPKDLFKKIMYFYLDPNYMAESGKLLCPRGRGSSCEVNSTLMNDQHIQWILKQISKGFQESAKQKPHCRNFEIFYI